MTIRKLVSSLLFAGRILTGRKLLDPVEVYFLPETETIYPINSKAGCSSVKLSLIRRYAPETELGFPEIHGVDPADFTTGRVERHLFDNLSDYRDFCRDRHLTLVTRDPYARMYSAYKGFRRGINLYYLPYGRIGKWLGFDRKLSLEKFIGLCSRLPGRHADRHFRPQSFYLASCVKDSARSWRTVDLLEFKWVKEDTAPIRLNASGSALPSETLNRMRKHRGFQRRYAEDLSWYGEA